MKLWVARDDSMNLAYVCVPENEWNYSFSRSLNEGQIATLDWEEDNHGWLDMVERNTVVVAWSPTGRVEDAAFLAVGRTDESTGDILDPTRRVTANCVPFGNIHVSDDFSPKILAWAKANLGSAPETCWKLGDDPESVDSYLAGRSGDVVVDPVTHAISYSDCLVGDRVVDLSAHVLEDLGIAVSTGSGEEPATIYTATVETSWTQSAAGQIDVAGDLPNFSTYNSDVQSIVSDIAGLDDGTGDGSSFSLDTGSIRARVVGTPGIAINVDGYQAAYKTEVAAEKIVDTEEIRVGIQNSTSEGYKYSFTKRFSWEPIDSENIKTEDADGNESNGAPDQGVDYSDSTFHRPVSASFVYEQLFVRITQATATWQLSQARREKMTVTLKARSALGKDPAMSFTVDQKFVIPVADAIDENATYKAGDVVLAGNTRWRATVDDPGYPINPVNGRWTRDSHADERDSVLAGRTPANDLFADPLSDVGEEIAQHVLCRLRREARRRARRRNLTFSVPWHVGIGITCRDAVRICVPWTAYGDVEVVGKVVAAVATWDGEGDPVVRITIGVVTELQLDSYGYDPATQPVLGDVPWEARYADRGSDATGRSITSTIRRLRLGGNPFFGSAEVENEAGSQAGRMLVAAAQGRDPAQAVVAKPTRIRVKLADLRLADEIAREISVTGYLVDTGIQRGIGTEYVS